jgi:hypothetical protein
LWRMKREANLRMHCVRGVVRKEKEASELIASTVCAAHFDH